MPVLVLAGFAAVPARADVAAGVAAFERGDYATAIDEWLVEASRNEPNALFNLGQAYRLGWGMEPDIDRAEVYYERAAQAGHPAAMGNLATLNFFSKTPPRIDEALSWWRRGALAGDPSSQYMLGALTFNGEHVSRDPARAYAWTWLSARTGFGEAEKALAIINDHVPEETRRQAARTAPSLMSESGRDYWTGMTAQVAAADESADAADGAAVSTPPKPSASPTPAAESAVVYRVNLATMASRADADGTRQRYRADHADLFADAAFHIAELPRDGETLYRLQVGGFASQAAAQEVCNEYKRAGVDCFVARASP